MTPIELPQNWMPQLNPISLKISEIEYECYTWQIPKTDEIAGYIKFNGIYRSGSAGTPDAVFIQWRIDEFTELATPFGARIIGLVVDFRNLVYTWGDDIDVNPDRLVRLGYPIYIVIPSKEENAKVHEAYKWAFSEERLREDLFTAFADVVRDIVGS